MLIFTFDIFSLLHELLTFSNLRSAKEVGICTAGFRNCSLRFTLTPAVHRCKRLV